MMSDARHTWTEPYFPLHAVDPLDDESPWAVEPETPADTLKSWIADGWGPGGFVRQEVRRG